MSTVVSAAPLLVVWCLLLALWSTATVVQAAPVNLLWDAHFTTAAYESSGLYKSVYTPERVSASSPLILETADVVFAFGPDGRKIATLNETSLIDWENSWVVETIPGEGGMLFATLNNGHLRAWSTQTLKTRWTHIAPDHECKRPDKYFGTGCVSWGPVYYNGTIGSCHAATGGAITQLFCKVNEAGNLLDCSVRANNVRTGKLCQKPIAVPGISAYPYLTKFVRQRDASRDQPLPPTLLWAEKESTSRRILGIDLVTGAVRFNETYYRGSRYIYPYIQFTQGVGPNGEIAVLVNAETYNEVNSTLFFMTIDLYSGRLLVNTTVSPAVDITGVGQWVYAPNKPTTTQDAILAIMTDSDEIVGFNGTTGKLEYLASTNEGVAMNGNIGQVGGLLFVPSFGVGASYTLSAYTWFSGEQVWTGPLHNVGTDNGGVTNVGVPVPFEFEDGTVGLAIGDFGYESGGYLAVYQVQDQN